MNIKTTAIMAAAMTLAVASAGAADILGKVTFKGTPPPNPSTKPDATCGPLYTGGGMIEVPIFKVGSKGELADVVVAIDGLSGKSTGASQAPAVLDQVKCLYTPYVLAIQTGQKLAVKNSDPMLHNVHSMPKPGSRNKEDNKAQLPKGPNLSFMFPDAEEFLRFKCDVHPWMFAYVSVMDHPYFDVSGADGTFTIKNVPAGKYTLVARHRKANAAGLKKEIEVKSDNVTVEFVLE